MGPWFPIIWFLDAFGEQDSRKYTRDEWKKMERAELLDNIKFWSIVLFALFIPIGLGIIIGYFIYA